MQELERVVVRIQEVVHHLVMVELVVVVTREARLGVMALVEVVVILILQVLDLF
jgi:hypothetical protein